MLKNLLVDSTAQIHTENFTERLFLKGKYFVYIKELAFKLALRMFIFSAIFEHVLIKSVVL